MLAALRAQIEAMNEAGLVSSHMLQEAIQFDKSPPSGPASIVYVDSGQVPMAARGTHDNCLRLRWKPPGFWDTLGPVPERGNIAAYEVRWTGARSEG